mgnify:CR=1 FL=1
MTALLADAKSVTIADAYLCDDQTARLKPNARRFFGLLPKHRLTLFCTRLQQAAVTEIKQISSNWKVKPDTQYLHLHDRYVRIDNKMEVVITSGIDYLFDTTKECTLLVRTLPH